MLQVTGGMPRSCWVVRELWSRLTACRPARLLVHRSAGRSTDSPARDRYGCPQARVVESADTAALKAAASRRAGSSPAPGTGHRADHRYQRRRLLGSPQLRTAGTLVPTEARVAGMPAVVPVDMWEAQCAVTIRCSP